MTLTLKNTSYVNSWHIWVYPAKLPEVKTDVLITQSPQEAMQALAQGKKVLLNPDYKEMKGLPGKFVPLFWSPVHFPEQAGATGLLCDPKHPALSVFPTDFHSDWQWWDLCTKSTAMILPDSSVKPIVRQIDNFANNRKLANVFEVTVGQGRLLVCSFDISSDLNDRTVARQLRHSLLKYMSSSAFNPSVSMSDETFMSIVEKRKPF